MGFYGSLDLPNRKISKLSIPIIMFIVMHIIIIISILILLNSCVFSGFCPSYPILDRISYPRFPPALVGKASTSAQWFESGPMSWQEIWGFPESWGYPKWMVYIGNPTKNR